MAPKHILLVDGQLEDRLTVGRVLNQEAQSCKVLEAPSFKDAQRLLLKFPIDLFFIDRSLPDGDGLDLLADVRTVLPRARTIMLAAEEGDDWQQVALRFGADRCLSKPVTAPQIRTVLAEVLGLEIADTSFEADLRQVKILDLVQLKCLNRQSTLFRVFHKGEVGLIHILNGDVVHAETPRLGGLKAFSEIIGWEGGRFEETKLPANPPRSIDLNWEHLYMSCIGGDDEESPASVQDSFDDIPDFIKPKSKSSAGKKASAPAPKKGAVNTSTSTKAEEAPSEAQPYSDLPDLVRKKPVKA